MEPRSCKVCANSRKVTDEGQYSFGLLATALPELMCPLCMKLESGNTRAKSRHRAWASSGQRHDLVVGNSLSSPKQAS